MNRDKLGTVSLVAVAGTNRDRLATRIGGHALTPAKYRLTVGSLSAAFTVLAPAKKRGHH